MPIHDLVFSYDFPPIGGGISRWVEEMARRYPPGTLRVSTGAMPGQAEVDRTLPNPVDRVSISSDRLKTLQGRLLWSRRAATLARDPASRFAWCSSLRPAGYPAKWAWDRTRLPYGIIVHGGDLLRIIPRFRRSWLKRRTCRVLFNPARVIIANSRWSADLCRQMLAELQLDHLRDRVAVVPLGTDPERFRPDPEGAEAFRMRRQLPQGRWLVTVARLVPHKGIDAAIRVVAELASRHPTVQYAIVGRGREDQALRALSRQLGIADRVHFLQDVADDELASAYSMASVYLGFSRENERDVEGFGISLAEASACGLPVVAARSGGIPDTIDDGVTGMLSEPEDHASACAAASTLLHDTVLARRMGDAGRKRVEQYLNWDRVVTEMRAIAADLGRKPGPRSVSRPPRK